MSAVTFAESLEAHRAAFMESLRVRGYAAASLKSYAGSLGVFYRFLAGRSINDVREADRETIRAYALWLSGNRPSGSGLYSTHTRLLHLKTLRRFFEHLETTHAIGVNPCVGVVLPKLEDRLPRTI